MAAGTSRPGAATVSVPPSQTGAAGGQMMSVNNPTTPTPKGKDPRMKRSIILTTALALIVAGAAYAGEGKAKHEHGPGGPHEFGLLPPKLREDLALTADQDAKVKE